MNLTFSVIPEPEIRRVLTNQGSAIQDIIKQAYLLHHQGHTINPNSYFLRYPEKPNARIIALPAHLGSDINTSGIKWIASQPNNIKKALPRASAVLILNDGETGFPFACLEAGLISATRTAASAVLAAEYLRKKNKSKMKLGIIGTSLIAKTIYQTFLSNDWEISELRLYDLNPSHAQEFKKHAELNNTITILCNNSDELILQSDVVVFATTAASPYITNPDLLQHQPLLLNISLRDLAPEILIECNNVVDDIEHVMNANTSPHLTLQKYKNINFVNGTLAALIQEEYTLSENKATVFSPMGMGILDLALGKFVYDQVVLENRDIKVSNFFGENYVAAN